jgi:hypothetical protein
MKTSYIYTALVLMGMMNFCSSCSHTSGLSAEQFEKLKTSVTGNWISSVWFDAVHENGLAQAGQIPCMEIIVSAQLDSLGWIEPGKELIVYPIISVSDSSFIIKRKENTVNFYYSADLKTLFMNDGITNLRLKRLPIRYAVSSIRGWMSGLVLFVNEDQMAGEYKLIDEFNGEHTICALTAYGEVQGLAGYKVFKLCISGNCLSQSKEDVITLSDEKSTDRYIWKWENDTMNFFSVRNTGTLDHPDLVRHEVIFRFVKK